MIDELLVGLGLVLVIEGVLWAAFPRLALHLLKAAVTSPEGMLRMGGLAAAILGVGLVWLARG
jgi:uncharacterized protein YjeT (DUF2065 family)